LYEGGSKGFSATAKRWTLPTISGDFSGTPAFFSTSVNISRAVSGTYYSYSALTFDLTGDGVSDLVLTYDQVDGDVGHKRWVVYEGGSGGFSGSAAEWSLPTISGSFSGTPAFYSTSVSGSRPIGSTYYSYYATTFDLTGDGGSDLVLTFDQADGDVGNTHWVVYEAVCE
jgi:hypothetical protein